MDQLMVRVVKALCDDVGTERAMVVKNHVLRSEWTELLQLRVRPQDYGNAEDYWKDAIVTDLLRKCENLPSTVDKEEAAVKTFYACEKRNLTTNHRLTRFHPATLFLEDQNDERVNLFIEGWRKDVNYVLGNLPDHLTPRFSGGATYADTGVYITIPDKMSSTPTIYQGARDLLPLWSTTLWCTALVRERPWQSDPLTVRGNIFFTVPKDAEKYRGCCKEASINVTYQLDIGRHMKNVMKSRLGIDLKTGQTLHRQLARAASVSGQFATIDMSNASDTLCRMLPTILLRGDWLELLNSLRATHTFIEGKWVRLEKFSSMGNGFTFELETLIFCTLARRIVKQEGGDPDLVKCYGDDLIVPSSHTKSVLAALAFFGFEPNARKTFAEGPFRESCGGDYFDGVPVRAHFLKELPDEPHKWIALANGLRRVASTDGELGPRWTFVRRAWLRVLDAIPGDIRRCRGPEHLGDIVIHDVEAEWSACVLPKRKRWSNWFVDKDTGERKRACLDDGSGPDVEAVRAWVPIPKPLPWGHWVPTVQLACCTLGYPSTGVTPRGGVSGYRFGKVASKLLSHWEPRPSRDRISSRDPVKGDEMIFEFSEA